MLSISKVFEELDYLAEEEAMGGEYNMADCQVAGLLSAVKKVYGEYRSREMRAYYNLKLSMAKGE